MRIRAAQKLRIRLRLRWAAHSALIILALTATAASAAVFQYSVPVVTGKGEKAAFLWIPSDARQVRGVVMCGMTLMEREFAKDERYRRHVPINSWPSSF